MTNASALPIQERLRKDVERRKLLSGQSGAVDGVSIPYHLTAYPEDRDTLANAAADRIDALEKALRASDTALNDWLARYAGEFCEESHVKEADQRISDAGGTLAYIAAVTAENRAALGEGE